MDANRMKELAGIPADAEINVKMLNEMQKPKPGQAFGTNDQDEPTEHTPDELSRIADLLYAAHNVGGRELSQKVFKMLPKSATGEFNYAKWEYVADKA